MEQELIGGPEEAEDGDNEATTANSQQDEQTSDNEDCDDVLHVEDICGEQFDDVAADPAECAVVEASEDAQDIDTLCDTCDEPMADCRCATHAASVHTDPEQQNKSSMEINENKLFQAFRDLQATEKVNSHVEHAGRPRSSDSTCSTASTMNAQLIKDKVKRHFKSQQQKQYARRVRKSGEAALATRQRREHSDNIKQSTSSDWF